MKFDVSAIRHRFIDEDIKNPKEKLLKINTSDVYFKIKQ